MHITLVVNPAAGGGRGRRVLDAALPLLRERGIEPRVHICANGGEPERLAREAAAAGAQVVIAVGGDGQARSVASGLLGTPAALGLLPAGSANDYSRAIGVPRNVEAAVRLLAEPVLARVDMVRVECADGTRQYLNVGGAGFDSIVAASAERVPILRGWGRYVLAVLRELPRFEAGDFRITADGTTREFRGMIVAIANGTSYGGGMRVAPTAHLQSGVLEVCIVGELSRPAFLRAFPSVFRGTHVNHPAVSLLHLRELELESEPAFEITGDGERIGRLPARFTVLPGALSVVVGARSRLV